jgi:transcriptional regulator with XRE-family HTH domain
MARAALDLGVRDLARIADVSPNTVARMERGESLHPRTLAYLRGALEAEGITFIDPGAVSTWGGAGVRLGNEGAKKSSMGKLFEALWNLPDLRTQPEKAYGALLDNLDRYLEIIKQEERQPDAWERLDLNDALHALNRHSVFAAASYLRHAITPPDNQSPDYPLSNEAIASTTGLDLAYFHRCSAALRGRGYVDADRT